MRIEIATPLFLELTEDVKFNLLPIFPKTYPFPPYYTHLKD